MDSGRDDSDSRLDSSESSRSPIDLGNGNRRVWIYGSLLVVVLLGTLWLNQDSRSAGYDLGIHLFRAWDTGAAFAEGDFSLYLSPNAGSGKGFPIYGFYSQWIYVPPFLGQQLGLSLLHALKASGALFLLIAVLGFYRLTRLHMPRADSLFGTLLFVTANYVLGELMVRWAYAELAAFAFLPWVLWALGSFLRSGRRLFWIAAVLFGAAMILAHPLSFMNSGPAFAGYVSFTVLSFNKEQRLKTTEARLVAEGAGWMGATLGLSAFFWFPALIEKAYVLGPKGLNFQYWESFPEFSRFLNPAELLGPGPVLAVIFGLWILWTLKDFSKAARNPATLGLGVPALLYFFLVHPLSRPIWDAVETLQANIFVYRLLFPACLLVVLWILTTKDSMLETSSLKAPLRGRISMLVAVAVVVQSGFFLWHHSIEHLTRPHMTDRDVAAVVDDFRQRDRDWGVREYLPARLSSIMVTPQCRTEAEPSWVRKESEGMQVQLPRPVGSCALHLPYLWNIRYQAFDDNGEPIPVRADGQGEILLFPDRVTRFRVELVTPLYAVGAQILSWSTLIFLLGILATIVRRADAADTADG